MIAASWAGCRRFQRLSLFRIRAVNSQCPAVDEGRSEFLASFLEESSHSCSGDAHAFGYAFLIQPFNVAQSERLEFLEGHGDFGDVGGRHTSGLEQFLCRR